MVRFQVVYRPLLLAENIQVTPRNYHRPPTVLPPDGGIVYVKIHNGPTNLWDWKVTQDVADALDRIEADVSIKVAIFKSDNDKFFIAHYDLNQPGPEAPPIETQQHDLFSRILFKIAKSRVIFIAEIMGAARGLGSEFILHCDMRFAAKTAQLGQPEITVGLIPGAGGIEYLVRLVGRARALEYILSGRDVDAITAEKIGWINQSFEPMELATAVQQLARRIASFSPEALSATKQRVNSQCLPRDEDILEDVEIFSALRKNIKYSSRKL